MVHTFLSSHEGIAPTSWYQCHTHWHPTISHPDSHTHTQTPSQIFSTLYGNNAWLTPPFSPVRVMHLQGGIGLTHTDTTMSHTPMLAHSHLIVNICLCMVIFHFGLVEMTNCHLIFELSGYYTHKLVPMSHPYINTSHLWALVRALPCLLTIKI